MLAATKTGVCIITNTVNRSEGLSKADDVYAEPCHTLLRSYCGL
jgi:hypothetical protein